MDLNNSVVIPINNFCALYRERVSKIRKKDKYLFIALLLESAKIEFCLFKLSLA